MADILNNINEHYVRSSVVSHYFRSMTICRSLFTQENVLQHLPCVHMLCCGTWYRHTAGYWIYPQRSVIFAGYILWESGSSAGRWIYHQRNLVFAGYTLCGNLVPLQVAGYTLRGIWYLLDALCVGIWCLYKSLDIPSGESGMNWILCGNLVYCVQFTVHFSTH